MKNYIYHHLGLGDSIVCNGLVRHFCEKLGSASIFAKNHNYETLKFMYRDNSNIEVICINGSDLQVHQYLNSIQEKYNIILVGFDSLFNNPNNKTFDVLFYENSNVNFNARWDYFKIERDLEKEKTFFDTFDVKEKEYVFIHDDERYKIDLSKIRNDLKIIKPNISLTNNMFDYCYLIENAKEVHTIESSFQFMIDSMSLNEENYAHRYPRPLTEIEKPVYKTVKSIII